MEDFYLVNYILVGSIVFFVEMKRDNKDVRWSLKFGGFGFIRVVIF